MTDKATPLPVPPPVLSKFGPAAVDRAINRQLQEAVPGEARTAIFDAKITSRDGERVVSGVVAANIGKVWKKVDIGGALGAAFDLDDRDDYEVELVLRGAW